MKVTPGLKPVVGIVMNVKNDYRYLIGLAVAIVLPLSFYVIAKALGKDKIAMPDYYSGDQKIDSHKAMLLIKDGHLQPVADLEATNQFGDIVSLNRDLPGKMLAINFFYTSEPSSPK